MKGSRLNSKMQNLIKLLAPFRDALLEADKIYIVGGAIRDAILGKETNDFDFAVSGKGIEFAKRFAKGIGGKFVLLDEEEDEARVVYKEARLVVQNEITFDFNGMDDIEDDLSQRDFTINAMAMDVRLMYNSEFRIQNSEFRVIDPYNGAEDIKNRIIRMINKENLRKDPLRILRAFRLSSTLGFEIESNTLKVLNRLSKLLPNVAAERIRNELFLILNCASSYTILSSMASLKILDIIIKEMHPMRKIKSVQSAKVAFGKSENLLDHSLLTVREIEQTHWSNEITARFFKEKGTLLKLAALIHDIGKPSCYIKKDDGSVHFYGHEARGVELLENIKEELKLSNKETQVLKVLIAYHMRPHLLASSKDYSDKAIWRLVRDAGDETPGLLMLAQGDALASSGKDIEDLNKVIKKALSIYSNTREPKFKRLISGDDLIKIGFTPGPIFKKILKKIEEAQIEGKLKTKQEAITFVKNQFILDKF